MLPRRRTAIAVSVLVHVLLVGALGLGLRGTVTLTEAPPIVVRLVPAWPSLFASRAAAHAPNEPRRSRAQASNTPPAATTAAPARPPSPPLAAAPPPAQSDNASPSLPPAALAALRGAVACDYADLANLSREEREACRKRRAELGRNAPEMALAIDPKERALFDKPDVLQQVQRGVLAEKPLKGCKLLGTGDSAPGGGSGVAVGIGCGIPF
jgi:hypothetical protein